MDSAAFNFGETELRRRIVLTNEFVGLAAAADYVLQTPPPTSTPTATDAHIQSCKQLRNESHSAEQRHHNGMTNGRTAADADPLTTTIASEMTRSSRTIRNATAATATTNPTTAIATTLSPTMKRSYSESSADGYSYRVAETVKSSGCGQEMRQNEVTLNGERRVSVSSNANALSTQRRHKKAANVEGRLLQDGYRQQTLSDMFDVGARVIMVIVFIILEITPPFRRIIHLEELWLYKNPRTPNIVTPATLLLAVIFTPFAVTLLHFMWSRDRREFRAASWSWTLGLCLNGLSTSLLKITVGRPRPDFFYRCFPDGVLVLNNASIPAISLLSCTGSLHEINEGYKSFPSGHSSFAFCSFGFIAIYLAGKLHTFNRQGRGETWRLLIFYAPLVVAALVAVSRTCDYHHHWQDVLVGALIGLCATYVAYRQYFPSIFATECAQPYPRGPQRRYSANGGYMPLPASACDDERAVDADVDMDIGLESEAAFNAKIDEQRPLISNTKQDNKWI